MTPLFQPEPPAAPSWLRRRIVQPLRAQLSQGTSPEKLALSVALGIALGILPLFGTATLLCVVVAIALRLNHPAIQLANQSMYLVQVPLLLVFVRVGETILGVAHAPLSAAVLLVQLREQPLALLERLGRSGLHGLVGWAVMAPLVAAAAYTLLLAVLRRRHAAA